MSRKMSGLLLMHVMVMMWCHLSTHSITRFSTHALSRSFHTCY